MNRPARQMVLVEAFYSVSAVLKITSSCNLTWQSQDCTGDHGQNQQRLQDTHLSVWRERERERERGEKADRHSQ